MLRRLEQLESYSTGLCTQIPSLPTARQTLPINRVLPDKPKGPRTSPYGWRKPDKYSTMSYDNKSGRHPTSRYFNHSSSPVMRKDAGHFQPPPPPPPRQRDPAQFSDIAAFHTPMGSGNVPSLTSLVGESSISKGRHGGNTVLWNSTSDSSPPSGGSMKHHHPSSSWSTQQTSENDKEIWENRLKENQELLRLYKHGFPSLNQTRVPTSSPARPSSNHHSNGYTQEEPMESHTHSQRPKDTIYQNIDPNKDIVNYEPLSKTVPGNSRVSHPVSRMINGYRSNPGIMTNTSPYPPPGRVTGGDGSNSYTHGPPQNFTYTFNVPKSPRIKHWGSRTLPSISERLNPPPPPPPSHGPRSAFSRPEAFKPLTSIEELHKIENSLKSSENSGTPTTDMLLTELSRKSAMTSPMKEKTSQKTSTRPTTTKQPDRRLNGQTTHFKTQMKRSLAIYLGVDPEIDTVQYQPLNKSLQKLHNQQRHVFSSQYCRTQEYGRKDDRDMRVQSKKKSVYSCGYDVSSINVMLQNAKKRFNCAEG